jgi:hypothetical protein
MTYLQSFSLGWKNVLEYIHDLATKKLNADYLFSDAFNFFYELRQRLPTH